jgi:tRNA pseudouridine55 synthase
LYAAARVQGKRLYEWARIQPTIVRPMRTMTVHAIDVIDIDVQRPHPTVRFRVTCAKGTYVRTLCVDIGARLGYPAHMRTLSRVECGGIVAQQCVGLDDVRRACAQGTLDARLWSIDRALSFLPSVHVDDETARRVLHGQLVLSPTDVPFSDAVRIVHEAKTIAICTHTDGHLRLRCVLGVPQRSEKGAPDVR